MRYDLAVLKSSDIATIVHVFTIEVGRDIGWVKRHADDLAKKCCPRLDYNALMVTRQGEWGRQQEAV